MTDLFGNPVSLLREAAKSPLGVLSLMLLLTSVLAYYFFSQASDLVRLSAFFMLLMSFVVFVTSIARLLPTATIRLQPGNAARPTAGPAIPENMHNELIRCSFSGLIRIEVNGLYLLVKGSRIPHQYQPVGGVHKRYPPSIRELMRLGVRNDDKMPADTDSQDDIRVRVPGHNVREFVNWFSCRTGREISPWREFYEELVDSGILSSQSFPYIACSFVETKMTEIRWSDHLQCQELLMAEIFELHPTPKQASELAELQKKENVAYRWVTAEEIRSRGLSPSTSVAFIPPTAEWLL